MAFTTRRSLLATINAGDKFDWTEFYETYKPLIKLRGKKDRGLSDSELDELVQTTVLSIFNGREKFHYDPAKGKFRNFLRQVIDCRAYDIIRKRHDERHEPLPEDDVLIEGKQPELERSWDDEWKDHVLKESLKELRAQSEPEAYQIFEFYALKDMSAREVAEFLGISENVVYVTKNRAIEKLREIIKKIGE
jgi:RNA polymerase sigma factor (sigma-70 family)